jgi:hypothetical protein
MAIYSEFSHWKWWFSIVIYSYVSLPEGNPWFELVDWWTPIFLMTGPLFIIVSMIDAFRSNRCLVACCFFGLTKTYQEKCPEHQLGPGSWVKRATIPLVNPGVQKLSDRPATPGRSMVRFAGKHLLQVIQKWGNMGDRINKHWTLLYPIVYIIDSNLLWISLNASACQNRWCH